MADIGRLQASLSSSSGLEAELNGTVTLEGSLGILTGNDSYNGPYVVSPRTDGEVVLDTANKTLVDDITVEMIRYIETSNLSGGNTVYIGGTV